MPVGGQMKKNSPVKNAAVLIGALIFMVTMGYGGWRLSRWFNWSQGYEAEVEKSIRKLVKPECLKVTGIPDVTKLMN